MDSGSFDVAFFDASSLVGSAWVVNVAAGASVIASLSWLAYPGGSHTIRAVADYGNHASELSESNNEASGVLYVGYPPDLALNTTDISFSSNLPSEGDKVIISATIHNQGGMDVASVPVQCFDGLPAAGALIGSSAIAVARGSETSVNYTWNATPAWTHGIYVSVDPSNEINESNENNNLAYRQIYVRTRPDLAFGPDGILLSPVDGIKQNDTVSVSVVLSNTGESGSGYFAVGYMDGSFLIGEKVVSVPGKSNVTVNVSWTPASPGYRNLSAEIDVYSSVAESSEANNRISRLVYVSPTSSSLAPCDLAGDYSPCGNVTVSEVASYLRLWSSGDAGLRDLVDLIIAWMGGSF